MNRPLALLLLSLVLAPAAPAAPTAVSWPLLDVVTLDSAAPSTPSDPAAAIATASLTSTGAETRVLARFPAAVFERDTNLLTRAELSLEFRAATWSPTRPLILHALTNAYDAAAATWTDRAADTPWRKPGGDLGTPSLPATRSTGATGYYIDLSPLLRDPETTAPSPGPPPPHPS